MGGKITVNRLKEICEEPNILDEGRSALKRFIVYLESINVNEFNVEHYPRYLKGMFSDCVKNSKDIKCRNFCLDKCRLVNYVFCKFYDEFKGIDFIRSYDWSAY